MRKWRLAVLTVIACTLLAGCGQKRPKERVEPAPEVNPKAVVWRTPEPPRRPHAGDVWVNPKDGMEMVYVAPGEFLLGISDAYIRADSDALVKELFPEASPETLAELRAEAIEHFQNDRPQCRVNLPGYWIGRTEVTNAQYLRFVGGAGHPAPLHWEDGRIPSGIGSFPVVGVDWEDARAYCRWAGGRLPSELQWEKAARGTDGRIYPWGDEWHDKWCRSFHAVTPLAQAPMHELESACPGVTSLGWSDLESRFSAWAYSHDSYREGPAAVGTYRSDVSPYGCLDMAGNVWEWSADRYEEDAYERYAKGDLKPPAGATSPVTRGGAWTSIDPGRFCVSFRGAQEADYHGCNIGFRCARDASP